MSDESVEQYQRIYDQSVCYLSYREHSVAELRIKLLKKFGVCGEIDPVLTQLLENDFLSEQRFAASYIRARVSKGFGPVHIRNTLVGKGLSGLIIDKALEESQVDWGEEICQVWQKKFKSFRLNSSRNNKAHSDKLRQWRFLQYRGFSQEQINAFFAQIDLHVPEVAEIS